MDEIYVLIRQKRDSPGGNAKFEIVGFTEDIADVITWRRGSNLTEYRSSQRVPRFILEPKS